MVLGRSHVPMGRSLEGSGHTRVGCRLALATAARRQRVASGRESRARRGGRAGGQIGHREDRMGMPQRVGALGGAVERPGQAPRAMCASRASVHVIHNRDNRIHIEERRTRRGASGGWKELYARERSTSNSKRRDPEVISCNPMSHVRKSLDPMSVVLPEVVSSKCSIINPPRHSASQSSARTHEPQPTPRMRMAGECKRVRAT